MSEVKNSSNNENDFEYPNLAASAEGADDLDMPLGLPDAMPGWMAALDDHPDEPANSFSAPEPASALVVATPDPPSVAAPISALEVLKEQISTQLHKLETAPIQSSAFSGNTSTMGGMEVSQSKLVPDDFPEKIPTDEPVRARDAARPESIFKAVGQVEKASVTSELKTEPPSKSSVGTLEFPIPRIPEGWDAIQSESDHPGTAQVAEVPETTIEMQSITLESPIIEPSLQAVDEPETGVAEILDLATEVQPETKEESFEEESILEMPDTLPDILESMAPDNPEETAGTSLEELIDVIDRQSEPASASPVAPQTKTSQSETGTNTDRYVVFSLAHSKYAIPIGNVMEMGRIPHITAVPYLPEWVRGVTNMRGDILSVIEFRAFLGMPPLEQTSTGRMLVIRSNYDGLITGLIVDGVNGMRELSADAIKPAAAPIEDKITTFTRGLHAQGDELLTVLDLESFLSSPEIRVS